MSSQMPEAVEHLYKVGALRSADYFFADFIRRGWPKEGENVLLAAALVSRLLVDSHVCLDLNIWAGQPFPSEEPGDVKDSEISNGKEASSIKLPKADDWKKQLIASGAVGKPGETDKPLILEDTRLYLQRYYNYEKKVAKEFLERAQPTSIEVSKKTGDMLKLLISSDAAQGGDRQRLAAYTALNRRLTVITGGPGTGKTYTVARLLVLAQLQHQNGAGGKPLNIRIAAPTGKAAARVSESIREAVADLRENNQIDSEILDQIPQEASTIHRLLGTIPGSTYFRCNRQNPLEADLVIIDEVSMIDLALMAKLLDALSQDTQLILLGDMDQLASVEAGSVFGDLCQAANPDLFSPEILQGYEGLTGTALSDTDLQFDDNATLLDDCLVRLYPSRRFPEDGAIGAIATVVNKASDDDHGGESAWKVAQGKFSTWDAFRTVSANETAVQWYDASDKPRLRNPEDKRPWAELRKTVMAGYKAYLDAETVEEAFSAAETFRVFCALRRGPYGVQTVNPLIEQILSLKDVGNISNDLKPRRKLNPVGEFYHRRLIMVTQNDYSLNLFNGDIGIIWQEKSDDEGASVNAVFPSSGGEGGGGFRRLPVNLLPQHETAFAMTVHKAQGSQFDKILLLLPPDDNKALFTRELLYTAVTRPSSQAILWCSEDIFKNCTKRKTKRQSGLYDRLLNATV